MNNILVNSRNLKIAFENIFHHKFISKLTKPYYVHYGVCECVMYLQTTNEVAGR